MKNVKKAPAKNITFSFRLHKKVLYVLLVAVGMILVWRGVWDLVDMYVFLENPLLSALISLFVGLVILYLPDQDIKELL